MRRPMVRTMWTINWSLLNWMTTGAMEWMMTLNREDRPEGRDDAMRAAVVDGLRVPEAGDCRLDLTSDDEDGKHTRGKTRGTVINSQRSNTPKKNGNLDDVG